MYLGFKLISTYIHKWHAAQFEKLCYKIYILNRPTCILNSCLNCLHLVFIAVDKLFPKLYLIIYAMAIENFLLNVSFEKILIFIAYFLLLGFTFTTYGQTRTHPNAVT